VRTSLQKTLAGGKPGKVSRDWKEAGRTAATVGDEVITLHDLVVAVKEYRRRNNAQQITRDQLNDIASGVLNSLIERSLLVQEAKRTIKNQKQIDRFMELADKVWREEQLPPLEYQAAVDSEQQLREKFTEQGRSLEALHQSFRQDFLAQAFLQEKLKDHMKVELPELLRYYNEHVHDREFDQPARITWRELVVEVSKHPNRDAARRKADALLEQLQKGADFAQLARTESEGPTSSRNQGGVMQTSPGAYAVSAVNEALESLPISQTSAVLEGAGSFHIVRVDDRRPAGPASFEELQDKIRGRLTDRKYQQERQAFIAKLRQRTLVSSMFEGTASDPNRPAD
jgi:parvulin-like peptidyl-prolyl isomerase